MADSTPDVLTQMGLLLTQLRYSRGALEQIERSTSKYAGIALKLPGDGQAGPLGAPPLIGGALKVHIVNIDDLTSGGSGIGDIIAGAIGGAGRFLGGLVGGFVGGTMSSLAFPWVIASLGKIVSALDRIVARLSSSPDTSKKQSPTAPPEPQRGILERLGSLVETLRSVAAVFNAASGKPVGGAAGGGVSAADTSAVAGYLALVRGIGDVAARLYQLLPILTTALASFLVRLEHIKGAILDLLQFALRNVLLLASAVLAVVGETLPLASKLVADVLAILGTAIDTVIQSTINIIKAGLDVALTALDVAGTGLKNTIDPLMTWLRDGLGGMLRYLGGLTIFRVVAHLASILPLVLPAIAKLKNMPLDASERSKLDAAAKIAPLTAGPEAGVGKAIAPFPNFAQIAVPKSDRENVVSKLDALGVKTSAEWNKGQAAVSHAAHEIAAKTGAALTKLDFNRATLMAGASQRAHTLAKSLQMAPADLKDQQMSELRPAANIFEQWLAGGGLVKLMSATEGHFTSPTATAVAGRVVHDVALGGAADRSGATSAVFVDIAEVTIDVGAPSSQAAAAPATAAKPDPDVIADQLRIQNERQGIVEF